MSVNSTDPKTLFGGTWERIAQGRTIVGEGVVQANSDNWCGTTNTGDWTAYAGFTGGEVFHTLTVSEMPSHSHSGLLGVGLVYAGSGTDGNALKLKSGGVDNRVTTQPSGSNYSHNNLPPYLVVYIWKRTA